MFFKFQDLLCRFIFLRKLQCSPASDFRILKLLRDQTHALFPIHTLDPFRVNYDLDPPEEPGCVCGRRWCPQYEQRGGHTRPARPGGDGFLGHTGLVCSAGGEVGMG